MIRGPALNFLANSGATREIFRSYCEETSVLCTDLSLQIRHDLLWEPGLPAIAECRAREMLAVPPSSRASPAPTRDCGVHVSALLGIPMSSSDHLRNAQGLRVHLSLPCLGVNMSKPITVLRDTHPLPVLDACKWEKLEGDPHTVNLNAYTSEDGSKIMGTWICTPGKWYVEYVKWLVDLKVLQIS